MLLWAFEGKIIFKRFEDSMIDQCFFTFFDKDARINWFNSLKLMNGKKDVSIGIIHPSNLLQLHCKFAYKGSQKLILIYPSISLIIDCP